MLKKSVIDVHTYSCVISETFYGGLANTISDIDDVYQEKNRPENCTLWNFTDNQCKWLNPAN